MSYVDGHVLVGIFAANHGSGQDGVGGCEAGGHCQTREESEAWYEGEYEGGGHEPSLFFFFLVMY